LILGIFDRLSVVLALSSPSDMSVEAQRGRASERAVVVEIVIGIVVVVAW
jgi:hypothetical protein